MKTIKIFILIIFFTSIKSIIIANPITIYCLNEVKIDSNGWQIELLNIYNTTSLDGWSITSLTDSADIKDNIIMEGPYLVLNQDNLKDSLFINPEGDIIKLYIKTDYSSYMEILEFGNVKNSKITAPKPYQSISRLFENYFFLDNTPTLGRENDSLNAMGYLDILVTDRKDHSLPNFEIMYYWSDWDYSYSFYTDQHGRYLFKNYAIKQRFWLKNFQLLCSKQILSEDTLDLVIKIDTTASGINNRNTNHIPAGYLLNQNYPNPFNNSTKIAFYLPKNDYVDLVLYDVSGKKIENLFSGNKAQGVHVFNWDAEFIASGTYIYQLKTADVTLSKKCILIK
jgi:hypothetical protein